MATLTGYKSGVVNYALTDIDTSAKNALGTRMFDTDGRELIYLQGCANMLAGCAVVYDEAFLCILAVQASIGPVAVALAAVVANDFGWFVIHGRAVVNGAAALADNKCLFATATPGTLDDSGAGAEEFIYGAYSRSALDTPSTGKFYAQLNFPFKTDQNLD